MDIKTHIRKKNVPKANKILRKGRGAWGDFVNGALEADEAVTDMQPSDSKPPQSDSNATKEKA